MAPLLSAGQGGGSMLGSRLPEGDQELGIGDCLEEVFFLGTRMVILQKSEDYKQETGEHHIVRTLD